MIATPQTATPDKFISLHVSPSQDSLWKNKQQRELNVHKGDRIAIVGRNGTGKSSLLQLIKRKFVNGISREEEPVPEHLEASNKTLTIDISRRCRIAYLDQFLFQDDKKNPIDYLLQQRQHVAALDDVHKVRGTLSRFGLKPCVHHHSISTLSGGEKVRLFFGSAAIEAPHLYLLDEPTNHLDIQGIDALAKALNECSDDIGAVVVSHNLWFIQACCNRLWIIDKENGLHEYSGTVQQFIDEIRTKVYV